MLTFFVLATISFALPLSLTESLGSSESSFASFNTHYSAPNLRIEASVTTNRLGTYEMEVHAPIKAEQVGDFDDRFEELKSGNHVEITANHGANHGVRFLKSQIMGSGSLIFSKSANHGVRFLDFFKIKEPDPMISPH